LAISAISSVEYQTILPLSEHCLICIKMVRRRVSDNVGTLSNRSVPMKPFERFIGWSTPVVPRHDPASLAQDLGYKDHPNCLARRQGKCPGLEYCHDCTWREGSTREQT
jgi:hypothetical protein